MSHGVPNTSVHLLGTNGGKSWKTADWGRTDGTGSLTVGGTFTNGTEGSYTLRVDVGGLPLKHNIFYGFAVCAIAGPRETQGELFMMGPNLSEKTF